MHGGRISVLEFADRRGSSAITAGTVDANPAWSADGTRIGFRRGLFDARRSPSAGGDAPQLHSLVLVAGDDRRSPGGRT